VNLDEEALNVVKFQKAYEASARLTQVWNSLADEVMKLVGA
jgi:flagellar hook-associated protein FlgK